MRSFWGSLALATVAATATAALIGLTGCTLYFDHHGDDSGDDQPPPCDDTTSDVATVRLVNPETLACQTFNLGGSCDGRCGPCPETAAPYIPPWGSCNSACLGKSETACEADPDCYVAKESNQYYNGGIDGQQEEFLGCYPLSQFGVTDSAGGCNTLDANGCTSDNGCTAIYNAPYGTGCGGFLTRPEQCPGAQFVACVTEGLGDPGVCYGQPVSCDESAPLCPSNSTPGTANGCYTGACIPQQYCGLL